MRTHKQDSHKAQEDYSFISPRSPKISSYWRAIDNRGTHILGIKSPVLFKKTLKVWALVLSSRFIPHTIIEDSHTKMRKNWIKARLYVPALWEERAREELYLYTIENNKKKYIQPQLKTNFVYILLLLTALFLFHIIRMGWLYIPVEHVPDAGYWIQQGKLDCINTLKLQEYWRTVTALTLHADIQHLLGNMLFSAIFLIILSKRLGIGLSIFLGLTSAIGANFLSATYHSGSYSSIGFSTALFSFIGIISANMMLSNNYKKRLALLPLAAGVALLALLGTGDARTDYIAHILGFICGLTIGLISSYILSKTSFSAYLYILDPLLSFLSLSIVIMAWCWAIPSF